MRRQVRKSLMVSRLAGLICGGLICLASLAEAADSVPQLFVPVLRPGNLPPVGPDVRVALKQIAEGNLSEAMNLLADRADRSEVWVLSGDTGETLAAAALHRALSQLDPAEQYDLLHAWMFPAPNRDYFRHWISLATTVQPPREFARLLGERPRPTSFPVAQVQGVPGVFSTGWLLVEAAHETGQLRRLLSELEAPVAAQVPGAALLQVLALSRDKNQTDAQLLQAWQRYRESVADRWPVSILSNTRPADEAVQAPVTEISGAEVLMALATLPRAGLHDERVRLLKTLMASLPSGTAPVIRPFLERALGHALLAQAGSPANPEPMQPNFRYWLPVETAAHSRLITGPATWVTLDDAVLHLPGAGHEVLQLRYPIAGPFHWHCEGLSHVSGRVEGGLSYGGHFTEVSADSQYFQVWDAQGASQGRRGCYFLDREVTGGFGRLDLDNSDHIEFQVNQHPLLTTEKSESHPWFGLCAHEDRRAMFRHLHVSNQPVIPRQVTLITNNALPGWCSARPEESQPFVLSTSGTLTEVAQPDWKASQGELLRELTPETSAAAKSTWLAYQRPLLDAEQWTYEFRYQPGQQEVHPAVGRVVFLLQPDGIQLRWITAGADEWTGLPAQNQIVEPLNRRGPRQLPLRVGDWNQVTVARQKDLLTVTLNNEEIYRRPIDWEHDHRIGFYCEAQRAAQIRNVVLQGDWPETLPAEFLQQPWQIEQEAITPAQQQALSRLFDDVHFANDVIHVRKTAAQLAPPERLDYLTKWVLPSDSHDSYRMWGQFTTTDPPGTPEATDVAADRGAHLVSPVFDWLDLARELQQGSVLRDRMRQFPVPADELQQRCHWALVTLLELAAGDEAAATEACLKLHALVKGYEAVGLDDQWPETLCLFYGVPHYPQFSALVDLMNSIYSQRTLQWKPVRTNYWHQQLAYLVAQHTSMTHPSHAAVSPELPAGDWILGGTMKSATRGRGHPPALWKFFPGEIQKLRGHDEDYVFYRIPLTGDFEIDAELSNPSRNPTQMLIGGHYIGPRWTADEVEVGVLAKSPNFLKASPKFQSYGPWVHYRGVVRDSVLTVYFNGRQAYQMPLPEPRHPWIGFRAWGRQHGAIRNLRILGNPQVLSEVSLIGAPELTGWYSYHHDEQVGIPGARWTYEEDPASTGIIVARSVSDLRGMWYESLLCYVRPMVSGEQLDLEFFYVPGESVTHPALDRLAFLLEPQGVREHWLTDSRYDRTGQSPKNVQDRAEYRRGPAALPFIVNDWNRLRVKLVDQQVQLSLNDQLIYERPIDPERMQTFGLFRYAGQSEVRVRRVVLTGDWPKTLPTLQEQSLADTKVLEINRQRDGLPFTFEHDFAKEGAPPEYFKLTPSSSTISVQPGPEGVLAQAKSTSSWVTNNIYPRLGVEGDFDLEVQFDQLSIVSDKDVRIMFIVQMDDEKETQHIFHRNKNVAGRHEVIPAISYLLPNKSRVYPTLEHASCEATAGRLRLARRGDQLHYLYSIDDSPEYQLLWTEPALENPLVADGIRIVAASMGNGHSSVLWKHLTLKAEKLVWYPESSTPIPRGLFIMQPDGTGMTRIADPTRLNLAVVGSSEWSPDGTMIAADMSNRSTSTSHIVVMNADGSNFRDLGMGCMPSISADNKFVVFSDPSGGITRMNIDGSHRTVIDRGGWGTQWSPDGKWIAYGKSGNIFLMDPVTMMTRQLFSGADASRYSTIYWNFGWSHDSQSIGFKARLRTGGDEVAVINIAPDSQSVVLVENAANINPDITFSARNDAVIFTMPHPQRKFKQIYSVSRMSPGAPELLENHPENLMVYETHWSRDGRQLVFTGEEVAGPVPWTAERQAEKQQPK
ncbi:DUF1583 domain-containing protein [bacterium]|nr:DUF1583 domain-containing protein [bacterium]